MSILDLLARGVQTSPLDVAKAGVRGTMDRSLLETASLDRQAKQMELDDFLLDRESRSTAREAGIMENQEFIDDESYRQEIRVSGAAAAVRKEAREAYDSETRRIAAEKKGKSIKKFKISNIQKAKFIGAMVSKSETFDRLSESGRKDYSVALAQAISDLMVADPALPTQQAVSIIQQLAENFVDDEGIISKYAPIIFSNEFDSESFRTAFNEKLQAMLSGDTTSPPPPPQLKEEEPNKNKSEAMDFVARVIGR